MAKCLRGKLPAEPGRSRCEKHLIEARAVIKDIRSDRLSRGVCAVCCKPVDGDFWHCKKHRKEAVMRAKKNG